MLELLPSISPDTVYRFVGVSPAWLLPSCPRPLCRCTQRLPDKDRWDVGDWRDECLTDPFDMSEMMSTSLGPRVGLGPGADAKYDKVWFLLFLELNHGVSQL